VVNAKLKLFVTHIIYKEEELEKAQLIPKRKWLSKSELLRKKRDNKD